MYDDVAANLGMRVRRARLAGRRHQHDVAAEANVSQSTLSRMELGSGGSVPLATWVRITDNLGLEIGVVSCDGSVGADTAIQRRCHRLVVERARIGGWASWTLIDAQRPTLSETILERPDRAEVAIVKVWDVLGDFRTAISDVQRSIERERIRYGDPWRVSGVVIIARTGHNIRRLSESGCSVDFSFPVRGSRWLASLSGSVGMPAEPGMIWTDQQMSRLRPFLPYVDHRRRKRSRQRVGRRRSAA